MEIRYKISSLSSVFSHREVISCIHIHTLLSNPFFLRGAMMCHTIGPILPCLETLSSPIGRQGRILGFDHQKSWHSHSTLWNLDWPAFFYSAQLPVVSVSICYIAGERVTSLISNHPYGWLMILKGPGVIYNNMAIIFRYWWDIPEVALYHIHFFHRRSCIYTSRLIT